MKVSLVEEMRQMDQSAVDGFGMSEEILMENAGDSAIQLITGKFEIAGREFCIFCGIGNNGGDGLVVARHLKSRYGKVKVFLLGDPNNFMGAARLNFQIANKSGIEIISIDSGIHLPEAFDSCDLIVDGIFGTGLSREVTGLYKEIIGQINISQKPVLSLDIPSGINGNTGEIMGAAVKASYTIAFGLPKLGNLLYPGYDYCGQLYVSHISFPPQLYDSERLSISINDCFPLPVRKPDGHKGDFGEALIIAGSSAYFGAPFFASMSFLKSGGGYARLACPASMAPHIASHGSEIVFMPMEETDQGSIALSNKQALLNLARKMDFVIVGPGLSLNSETQQLARELVKEIDRPILIDGDGISAISAEPGIFNHRQAPVVLTPHMGEMSRLTDLPLDGIFKDKINVLKNTSKEWNAIIVLKGAHSLISSPNGKVKINLTGNSGMATPGSGDVLDGVIAAMVGLGLDLYDAVLKGVFIHGVSGDLAANEIGADGMTAQDIMNYLPLAVKMDRAEELHDRYHIPTL
jgi:ADP-dependent NAD(P)H-hydrate dehydratase / NAD(P)H-hydrate epimerase